MFASNSTDFHMAGIYLHIPFCKRRCIYCDFYSTTATLKQEIFTQSICKEIVSRKAYLDGDLINTIYLGGGTPSQLTPTQLQQILQTIEQHYTIDKEAEITIEGNPDDLTLEYLRILKELGFNRLSIGIQTFDDPLLKLLRRRHSAQQAIEAVEISRKAGFENISIDLIYGLPQQTPEGWEKDLQQAIDLTPEHISAYSLTYEEGTTLWKMRAAHRIREADEDTYLAYFKQLINTLRKAGYIQYEISNFSKPGFQSRHNSNYWKGIKYLGCGPSAHSFDGASRRWNQSDLDAYIHGINSKGEAPFESEQLDEMTRYNERIITSIRTMEGLSIEQLQHDFGEAYLNYCREQAQRYINQGLLIEQNGWLRLTETGIFLSDGIMSDLLKVD